MKPLFWLMIVLGLWFGVPRTAAQDSKNSKKSTDSPAKEKESPKAPSIKDILDAGRKVIVFTYQDFNKIDKPNGAFLPGVDATKLKDGDAKTRPTAGGVTRLEITGDLSESWAALNVVVEARVDDPQGGNLALAFQEAQCSKAELKFHDPAWDASEFVPVEPAPLVKQDVSSPYVLRLDKPGSYILRLKLDVEIDRGPLERQLTLTLPRAPVKSVKLVETAVREGIRIEGARRSRTERDVSIDADGKTFIPRLLPDESLDLKWRLVADEAGKAAETSYTVVARSRIRGRQLETTTEFAMQSRRERREWTIRLPDGEAPGNVQVLQEGRAIVATMESLKNGGEESRVRIQTADNVVGSIKLLLTSTRPLASIPASPESLVIELSPSTLDGDAATKAYALVSVKDDEEVRVTPSPRQEHGVESVSPESIDAEAPIGPRTAAFQYVRPDAKLPLKLERLKPVLALAAPPTVTFRFEPKSVVVHADFRLLVKQGKLDGVVAALPADADDVRATMEGVARSAAPGTQQPNGVRLWTIAFGERRSGESLLQLSASIPTTGTNQRLPVPYLPDIQDSATMVALTKAAGVQVVLAPDELKEFQLVNSGPRQANQAWLTLQTRSRGAVLAATTNQFHGKSTAAVEHRLSASDANLRVTTTIRWENRVEPFSEVRLTIPEGVTEAVVKGERLAAPPGGIALSPGPAKLPLAAPSESCTVVVEYVTPIAKEGTTAVPLTTPVGDVIASCFAELRAQPGRRPLTPANWEATSPDRHLGELLDPENPYVGLLVRSETPPTSIAWKSEPAGSLAEIVVPRMMIVEDLTGSGRRRGRLLAVLAHRRTPVCEILLPPGCTVAETYLDGKLAPVVSSTRGERPSLTLRLPNDERPVSLEIRYEATCKSLSAARNLGLAVPKFGGDVVVDQVLWRIATPTNVLLGSFGEEVTTPAPNLWRFDRRLPGIWGFEPVLDESNAAKSIWLDGGNGNVEWAAAPSDLFQNRRWSFMTWGNAGSLNVTAIREPFWILAASALVLAAAGGVLGAKRRDRPWVASGIGFLVGLVWLISPRAMAWFWIGGRWALAALAVGLIGWMIRAFMQNRRRQRLAKRSLTLVARITVPKTPALAAPSASSLKRRATVE